MKNALSLFANFIRKVVINLHNQKLENTFKDENYRWNLGIKIQIPVFLVIFNFTVSLRASPITKN